MARSKGGILLGAIAAVAAYSALNRLTAFVGHSPASTPCRSHLRQSVILAAISKDDVQKA
eukprot:CAMPEP_0179046604 /NCGR_PEP_ID=MMETSP0796-20121207/18771_1 /TAXON_ID=73915 /ORGANISM="Pyrodinium bahamense, Strain pbaha01" /LENGTH=59 /DNA_ID=CAMNT_0020743031 /DNA_START=100 /DNA_END=275 /DNA_ORIENTATION=-